MKYINEIIKELNLSPEQEISADDFFEAIKKSNHDIYYEYTQADVCYLASYILHPDSIPDYYSLIKEKDLYLCQQKYKRFLLDKPHINRDIATCFITFTNIFNRASNENNPSIGFNDNRKYNRFEALLLCYMIVKEKEDGSAFSKYKKMRNNRVDDICSSLLTDLCTEIIEFFSDTEFTENGKYFQFEKTITGWKKIMTYSVKMDFDKKKNYEKEIEPMTNVLRDVKLLVSQIKKKSNSIENYRKMKKDILSSVEDAIEEIIPFRELTDLSSNDHILSDERFYNSVCDVNSEEELTAYFDYVTNKYCDAIASVTSNLKNDPDKMIKIDIMRSNIVVEKNCQN